MSVGKYPGRDLFDFHERTRFNRVQFPIRRFRMASVRVQYFGGHVPGNQTPLFSKRSDEITDERPKYYYSRDWTATIHGFPVREIKRDSSTLVNEFIRNGFALVPVPSPRSVVTIRIGEMYGKRNHILPKPFSYYSIRRSIPAIRISRASYRNAFFLSFIRSPSATQPAWIDIVRATRRALHKYAIMVFGKSSCTRKSPGSTAAYLKIFNPEVKP